MTAPLTPSECDLQDFPRMMIDIPRLFGSEFDATASDTEWRCGVTLWLKSFHQVPAASLPDDDVQLARLCGLGRDVRTWKKIRAGALRGWLSAEDGRLYHPFVAEIALEAWLEKLTQRLSSGAGNAARWGTEFDPEPIKAEIGATARMLASLNPKSKALSKQQVAQALQRSQRDTPSEVPTGPPEIPSGSQGKGREEKKEPPKPPEGAFAPDPTFDEAVAAYPASGRATNSPAKARAAWAVAVVEVGAPALLAAVLAYAAHVRAEGSSAKAAPAFHRWLSDRRWENFLGKPGAKPAPAWPGPPDVWAAVAGAKGDAFARSWLADCTWQDVPARTLISRSGTVINRLRQEVGPLLTDMDIQLELRAA